MSSDNREKIVAFQKLASSLISMLSNSLAPEDRILTRGRSREEIWASADVVMHKTVCRLFRSKVFDWICPQDVTHQTMGGRFTESVNLVFWTISTNNRCDHGICVHCGGHPRCWVQVKVRREYRGIACSWWLLVGESRKTPYMRRKLVRSTYACLGGKRVRAQK